MSDPYAPAWRPAYTGPDPALGDVGSGRGFGADLYQLYKAGRSELPAAEASTESDGWRCGRHPREATAAGLRCLRRDFPPPY